MKESGRGDYRRIQQDDREFRLLRPFGKTQQTTTGPLRRGDVTQIVTITVSFMRKECGPRQRELVLFTNKL